MGGLKVQAGSTEIDVDALVALSKRAGEAILGVYATGGEVSPICGIVFQDVPAHCYSFNHA